MAKERETIIIDGIPRRLAWIAKYRPEVLTRRIASGSDRSSAYWSALAKEGWTRQKVMAHCDELGVDAGQIGQQ